MGNYTVKQLARLSGVSVRTLHHYDEIGLLKPAFLGENRYRYYGREELLRLQDILFHRELGVPLQESCITTTRSDCSSRLSSARTAIATTGARSCCACRTSCSIANWACRCRRSATLRRDRTAQAGFPRREPLSLLRARGAAAPAGHPVPSRTGRAAAGDLQAAGRRWSRPAGDPLT